MKLLWSSLLLLPMQASLAAGATFDGTWKITYPCTGATGIYAERCKEGLRDYFELQIWTSASNLCAGHAATAYLGNRVDEAEMLDFPTITGRKHFPTTEVMFTSSWGATGKATLTLRSAKLYWKVINQEGEGWLPQQATLTRISKATQLAHPPCQE